MFPGAHKIGAAVSGPRIAGQKYYGHEDFSDKFLGPAPLQKCVEDFCCINLEGIFLDDFSGHFFPTKMIKIRRQNPQKSPAARK